MRSQKLNQMKQKPIDYILREDELPQTDQPTPDNPLNFYKSKHLVGSLYTSEIGILVLKFNKLQEDFVIYLVNILMCEADFLKISIVNPNNLYFSMNISSDSAHLSSSSEIELESNIFYLLQRSTQIFNKYADSYLSDDSILEKQQTTSDFLIDKFMEEVVTKIQNLYTQFFKKD